MLWLSTAGKERQSIRTIKLKFRLLNMHDISYIFSKLSSVAEVYIRRGEVDGMTFRLCRDMMWHVPKEFIEFRLPRALHFLVRFKKGSYWLPGINSNSELVVIYKPVPVIGPDDH